MNESTYMDTKGMAGMQYFVFLWDTTPAPLYTAVRLYGQTIDCNQKQPKQRRRAKVAFHITVDGRFLERDFCLEREPKVRCRNKAILKPNSKCYRSRKYMKNKSKKKLNKTWTKYDQVNKNWWEWWQKEK